MSVANESAWISSTNSNHYVLDGVPMRISEHFRPRQFKNDIPANVRWDSSQSKVLQTSPKFDTEEGYIRWYEEFSADRRNKERERLERAKPTAEKVPKTVPVASTENLPSAISNKPNLPLISNHILKPEIAPVKHGTTTLTSLNYKDFESVEDPFETAELRILNDKEELKNVLFGNTISDASYENVVPSMFGEAAINSNSSDTGVLQIQPLDDSIYGNVADITKYHVPANSQSLAQPSVTVGTKKNPIPSPRSSSLLSPTTPEQSVRSFLSNPQSDQISAVGGNEPSAQKMKPPPIKEKPSPSRKPVIPRGRPVIPPGRPVVPPGRSATHPDGSAVPPDGSAVAPDGSAVPPDLSAVVSGKSMTPPKPAVLPKLTRHSPEPSNLNTDVAGGTLKASTTEANKKMLSHLLATELMSELDGAVKLKSTNPVTRLHSSSPVLNPALTKSGYNDDVRSLEWPSLSLDKTNLLKSSDAPKSTSGNTVLDTANAHSLSCAIEENAEQKPSLPTCDTNQTDVTAKTLLDMGFDSQQIQGAMNWLGPDMAAVVDHLFAVQTMVSHGIRWQSAHAGLMLFKDDKDKASKYASAYDRLQEFGFAQEKIRNVLLTCDIDIDKALGMLVT